MKMFLSRISERLEFQINKATKKKWKGNYGVDLSQVCVWEHCVG